MKLIMTLGLLAAINVNAGTIKEYDSDALDLLYTVFTYCPKEFAEAMDGANRIGKATFSSPRPASSFGPIKEIYTISTVGGGYAPFFESYEVATLTIEKESIPDESFPDIPTGWKTTCTVHRN